MTLGYRYLSGIAVSPSCEKALDFYRQVADKGIIINLPEFALFIIYVLSMCTKNIKRKTV